MKGKEKKAQIKFYIFLTLSYPGEGQNTLPSCFSSTIQFSTSYPRP